MDSSFDMVRRPAETLDTDRSASAAAWQMSGGKWLLYCAVVAMGGLLTQVPVQADTITKVYQSRMQDGSVVFGDKPEPGASELRSREYRLPDPLPDDVLEAERLEWEHQARAFDQRHAERQAIEAQARLAREAAAVRRDSLQGASYTVHSSGAVYPGWASQALPIMPPPAGYASQYRSSPGAINGRQGSFLGSGFMAHPVRP